LTAARDGLLVFTVADTGTGLPSHVADSVFQQEVATGDLRGTGLGLPSCALFCKVAGGYCRLKSTRPHLDDGTNGFTEFEFAVRGSVVRADVDDAVSTDLAAAVVNLPTTKTTSRGDANSTTSSPRECASTANASQPRVDDDDDDDDDSASTDVTDDDARLPENLTVVVVDDSSLNRTCVIRALARVQRETGAANWTFHQFETIEQAQPCLREIHDAEKKAVVCLDEQMGSRGGVMTGIQGTKWLLHDLHFKGIVISTSGDPDAGLAHIKLGAHYSWGKPLPKHEQILDDLLTAFAAT